MPLRVRDGKWHYRFCVDGREYTGSTDLVATERKKNAAMRVEAKSREFVMNGRAHELKLHIKPFGDAATAFLQWADGEHVKHPNTATRLHTSFASLRVFFGNDPVSSILVGHLNDYKAWRRKEHGVAEITIRHDLHALSKAYRYFIDHNWARENPVKGVEIPSDKDAVRMYVLQNVEEAIYFKRARRFPALYDLGRLMINLGCRPEEILELQTADIDVERSRLTIRAGKSLAARRTLLLTSETREICARRVMIAKSHWLFAGKTLGSRLTKLNGPHTKVLDDLATCECGHAKHQHPLNAKCVCGCTNFKEVSRLAFVMYDFRHTFATRAAESGMPIATLAAILGHCDLRSVMKYVHVRQEALDRAMEQFEEARNKPDQKRSSGFRPVELAESRENAGSSGMSRESLSERKIN
jgi:integrase